MSWTTKIPLIAILRGITPNGVSAHINVLIEIGFDAIEIPLNSPEWETSIKIAVDEFGHKALIGAGTVLQPKQVDILAALGSKLIVTPNTNPQVIKQSIEHNMVVCCGAATATEAFVAIDAGAQNIKIFPSSAFGPDYIKALNAVLPKNIPVFAVGGVTPQNLHQYLAVGCLGAGLGGDLYKAGQSVDVTKRNANAFINAFQHYHGEK